MQIRAVYVNEDSKKEAALFDNAAPNMRCTPSGFSNFTTSSVHARVGRRVLDFALKFTRSFCTIGHPPGSLVGCVDEEVDIFFDFTHLN